MGWKSESVPDCVHVPSSGRICTGQIWSKQYSSVADDGETTPVADDGGNHSILLKLRTLAPQGWFSTAKVKQEIGANWKNLLSFICLFASILCLVLPRETDGTIKEPKYSRLMLDRAG